MIDEYDDIIYDIKYIIKKRDTKLDDWEVKEFTELLNMLDDRGILMFVLDGWNMGFEIKSEFGNFTFDGDEYLTPLEPATTIATEIFNNNEDDYIKTEYNCYIKLLKNLLFVLQDEEYLSKMEEVNNYIITILKNYREVKNMRLLRFLALNNIYTILHALEISAKFKSKAEDQDCKTDDKLHFDAHGRLYTRKCKIELFNALLKVVKNKLTKITNILPAYIKIWEDNKFINENEDTLNQMWLTNYVYNTEVAAIKYYIKNKNKKTQL